jgi:tRNA pseudouridine32 synthase/23S rRNA pseudouridine746 synthase
LIFNQGGLIGRVSMRFCDWSVEASILTTGVTANNHSSVERGLRMTNCSDAVHSGPAPLPSYRLVADCADFLLIDKAPGISVHRDREVCGLVERVAVEQGYTQLYLVHRLDRMTTGLLLLAKSGASCAALARQFAERKVEKMYVALSDRKPLKKQGSIRGDMLRARDGAWRLARSLENPALTVFHSRSVGPRLRLFVLRPRTGKTHQLRVAMKSIGAPILGDSRYGGSAAERGYLHACALRFEYAGEIFCFSESPQIGRQFGDPVVRTVLQEELDGWRREVGCAQ